MSAKQERIIQLTGAHSGKTYDVEGVLTIGRNPDSAVYLDDIQVSRRHAEIERAADGVFLKDLHSGNGTYVVEGETFKRIAQYRLTNGDVFRVGGAEFRFESQRADSAIRFQSADQGRIEASNAANVYETFFRVPDQAATADQHRDIQKRLTAVYKANEIMSSERDLRKLFDRVMEQIFSLVPAHNGVIMLAEEKTGSLVTEYVKSGSAETIISSKIVSRAFDQGEAVIIYDAADDARFGMGGSIIAQNISSVLCAPLVHQGKTLGVVYVDTRGTTNAFVKSDLEMLVALAGPAATAISNSQYLQKLERQYRDTLIGIASLVEMRDHYTVGHTWRVTHFAIEIAKEFGWSDEKLKQCEMGGVLHDVGKIAVNDAVLMKPTKLTEEEFAQMKVHPERGARFLRDWELLRPLVPYCLYHHERYDGKGYPTGLAGEEIPIEGRVIAVADTFDAMTSNRPYRKGLPPDVAIAEILNGRGTQFDPKVADALAKCYREGKITRIIQESLKGGKSIVCPFCSTYISIPEGANEGDKFQCKVCRRRVQLCQSNEAFFGELLPEEH